MPWGDRTIWVGHDEREALPYAVARDSLKRHSQATVHGIVLQDLIDCGWYTRPTETRRLKPRAKPVLWDVISEAPMSTQFAISRFFVPHLAIRMWSNNRGWALFVDCDVLALRDVDRLFFTAEQHPDKALMCVPHNHNPTEATKKDNVPQARVHDPRYPGVYNCKNWSSVMLFNLAHPANDKLTIELLNTVPGRDLHRFCWLDHSKDIGFLDVEWNHLVGVDGSRSEDPAIVHFTNGGPWLPKYAGVEYADAWRTARDNWAR